MSQTPIADLWEKYLSTAYRDTRPDTDSGQYIQLKRCFFGAIYLFMEFSSGEMTDGPADNEAADLALMANMQREITEFFAIEVLKQEGGAH